MTVTVAEFTDVQATGALGQWQVAEVGIDHPDNSREALYVTLEDSLGRTAPVSYPDATPVHAWTPWRMPFADFPGLNLGAIRKMSIGVGNPAAPTPGGTGVVYFDDIQVVTTEPNEPGE
jgi:hypothetical protein